MGCKQSKAAVAIPDSVKALASPASAPTALASAVPPKEFASESSVIPRKHSSLSGGQLSNVRRKLSSHPAAMGLLNLDFGDESLQEFTITEEDEDDEEGIDEKLLDLDPEFDSLFNPSDMRCLGLVAHNHMKPALKDFVLSHKNLLKKFRLTGTNTTMTMLKSVFGDDPTVQYGPTCQSGPLGGDAELVAVMCQQDLGGVFFFQDPMDQHPHQADIDCLNRQAVVHNVLMCHNPTSAHASCYTLRLALSQGRPDLIPSFFLTAMSPSVTEYKNRQNAVLQANMGNPDAAAAAGFRGSVVF